MEKQNSYRMEVVRWPSRTYLLRANKKAMTEFESVSGGPETNVEEYIMTNI